MMLRRSLLAASLPVLGGCGSRQKAQPPPPPPVAYVPEPARPSVSGLDAVIDISHNVTVSDFRSVRGAGILAVIHKVTEGGDWFDKSYAARRPQAEQAGLLWGGYHFGTRQYTGTEQANAFLNAARPGPGTLLALDLEPNDGNPGNTMTLGQAESFVRTVQQKTGRLPVVYTHSAWANGERYGRRRTTLDRPVGPSSILAQCDLWLADYREYPEVPYAWADKGWRLWQYIGNEDASHAAYGSVPRAIPGVSHCDRNLFNGDEAELQRFWRVRA